MLSPRLHRLNPPFNDVLDRFVGISMADKTPKSVCEGITQVWNNLQQKITENVFMRDSVFIARIKKTVDLFFEKQLLANLSESIAYLNDSQVNITIDIFKNRLNDIKLYCDKFDKKQSSEINALWNQFKEHLQVLGKTPLHLVGKTQDEVMELFFNPDIGQEIIASMLSCEQAWAILEKLITTHTDKAATRMLIYNLQFDVFIALMSGLDEHKIICLKKQLRCDKPEESADTGRLEEQIINRCDQLKERVGLSKEIDGLKSEIAIEMERMQIYQKIFEEGVFGISFEDLEKTYLELQAKLSGIGCGAAASSSAR